MPPVMSPANAQKVFGFNVGFDWRPTCFVNPFPSTRVCSVCGLVPPTVVTLPCRHFLCQPCYERRGCNSSHCPLDGEVFQEEDVVWATFSRDSVLGRKVRCWNAEHGCDAEDTASAMLEHFASACQFHAVTCTRCRGEVLHRDIAEHLEFDCVPSHALEQLQDDNFVVPLMEIKEALGKILGENAAMRTKLDSFADRLLPGANGGFVTQSTAAVDAMRDALENRITELGNQVEVALAEHRREVTSEVRDALRGTEGTIKDIVSQECNRNLLRPTDRVVGALCEGCSPEDSRSSPSETSGRTLTLPVENESKALRLLAAVSMGISSDILNTSVPYEWTIDNWAEFLAKSSAACEWSHGDRTEPTYHYGYLIVPRLCFCVDRLWLRIYVFKGLFDQFLKWPMNKKIKLLFINPCDSTRYLTLISPFNNIGRRPLRGFGVEVVGRVHSNSMSIQTLNEHALVGNNALRLQLEFEP